MSALQHDKTKSWFDCSNRCMGSNGIRRTRKRIWIHGWPIPLCDGCLKSSLEAWDGALKRIKAEDAEEKIAA